MDSFASAAEWELYGTELLLEGLDFASFSGFPAVAATDDDDNNAWFCSNLDCFNADDLACGFGGHEINGYLLSNSIEQQLPHFFMSADASGTEVTAFCGGNVGTETLQQEEKVDTLSNVFHHKRKLEAPCSSSGNPTKKIRASKNKNRKSAESNNKNQKLSSADGRKYEEDVKNNNNNNAGSDINSSSSYNSEDDNTSQETNGVLPTVDAETSPVLNLNRKTRASRGSATDPQSLYARKRREKINERLKILQKLVPNGTKVDISTMLEEAVHYVKFLQLQIKLLSSDELWMYAPIAYNGMDIGLQQKLSSFL